MPRPNKRPFQPSITSYFLPDEERPSTLSRSDNSSRHPSAGLPAAVQSSLLNVGMRVRKSVPEGYKTKGVSNTTPKTTTPTEPASGGGMSSDGTLGPRELAPFCGILKVGGYDCQQTSFSPEVQDLPPLEYDAMDGDSLPGSSQESIATIPPTSVMPASFRSSHPNKRLFQDDEDDESYSTDLVIYEDEEVPLSSQRWCHQDNVINLDADMSRSLAQPKTRRRGLASPSSKRHAVDGQENTGSSMFAGGLDFEEAAFLQPSDVVCDEMGMDDL